MMIIRKSVVSYGHCYDHGFECKENIAFKYCLYVLLYFVNITHVIKAKSVTLKMSMLLCVSLSHTHNKQIRDTHSDTQWGALTGERNKLVITFNFSVI